ncbi:MAG: M20 family metallopeptidase [Rhodobiaceae bacterium]|nr:M20 family metallopeptidase [Rhodobiaceae bacterium]
MSEPRTPEPGEILSGIERWTRIESHTADRDGVNALMGQVASECAAIGASVERVPGRDGFGDHLSVRSPWGGDGKYILVLSHLDTVHPRGTIETDLPLHVDGDNAYGPGIYDMKGGAHIGFLAFKTLAEAGGCPLPVRVLYTGDEEVGSPTSRALIEEAVKDAAYVLVTEPARDGGKIVTSRNGVARFVMRTRGRPAHSGSRHHQGRSAIREIARQILTLEAMTDYKRGITVNIGMVKGGSGANVVPEYAEASVDIRVPTAKDGESMVARVQALTPCDPDVALTFTGGMNRPPYERLPGTAALFETAKGLAAEIGFALEETHTGGGSDGNFTAPVAPTLDGLGVDGEGAHTLHEHLFISSLVPRMLLLRRLMQTLT